MPPFITDSQVNETHKRSQLGPTADQLDSLSAALSARS